jgi:20S proteasome subunit beta 2
MSAALIVGGVDFKGPSIYSVSPHGYVANPPFTATGSGGYAAMSVLESGWRRDLDLEEAKALIANAIEAGITNDLGSGSNMNLIIVNDKGGQVLLKYRITNERPFRLTTPVTAIDVEIVKEVSRPLVEPEVLLDVLDDQ